MLTNRIVKWFAVFLLIAQIAISKENVLDVYFGTMGRAAEGIYRTQFLTDTGRFRSAQLVAQVQSPNFLTQHPNDAILYAVCKGERVPSIIAYKIKKDGTLHEFSRMDSPQGLACHVCVHPSGRFLLTAHYSVGAISAFPLDERGKIGQPKVYAHSGSSGIVAKRQASAHPHWTGFSPDGRYALIPDLGLDQIIIYKVEIGVELLSKHAIAETDPGAGPRHMRFSNNGKFIYLLNELQSSVTVFSWDADTGTCRRIASYETLSEQVRSREAFNSAAEILVHPQLNCVYTSNRGHDSITVFQMNNLTDKLRPIQTQAIRGAFPRHISLSPKGDWLLAAGMHSNTVSAHRVDPSNGQLRYATKAIVTVPSPSCIIFLDATH